ncbi:hypothetical protein PM022_12540 [Halorubrum ezzemoulense]|nr:hypothetical protein [Halorubrum ezzemoulense]MDB2275357.1 hypothetical protein [Halorubrum ezzemoulense]
MTEAGYEKLADADETLNAEDGTYIWKEADRTDVQPQATLAVAQ